MSKENLIKELVLRNKENYEASEDFGCCFIEGIEIVKDAVIKKNDEKFRYR